LLLAREPRSDSGGSRNDRRPPGGGSAIPAPAILAELGPCSGLSRRSDHGECGFRLPDRAKVKAGGRWPAGGGARTGCVPPSPARLLDLGPASSQSAWVMVSLLLGAQEVDPSRAHRGADRRVADRLVDPPPEREGRGRTDPSAGRVRREVRQRAVQAAPCGVRVSEVSAGDRPSSAVPTCSCSVFQVGLTWLHVLSRVRTESASVERGVTPCQMTPPRRGGGRGATTRVAAPPVRPSSFPSDRSARNPVTGFTRQMASVRSNRDGGQHGRPHGGAATPAFKTLDAIGMREEPETPWRASRAPPSPAAGKGMGEPQHREGPGIAAARRRYVGAPADGPLASRSTERRTTICATQSARVHRTEPRLIDARGGRGAAW